MRERESDQERPAPFSGGTSSAVHCVLFRDRRRHRRRRRRSDTFYTAFTRNGHGLNVSDVTVVIIVFGFCPGLNTLPGKFHPNAVSHWKPPNTWYFTTKPFPRWPFAQPFHRLRRTPADQRFACYGLVRVL